ncbi:LPS export ABC transporter periplasmic protein LptC [Enterovirga sp. GCM10030262]|uniref:LPS export ABC transporter periplasmic protein LptC n=1 Tax=Enterovirga sp. GCM10030262 TaxID=3273391 RepID=UPI003623619D
MSELAERERVRKQGWAAPGGAHDRVVRLLKLALPVLIGVLMAYLALAPLSSGREISFILDKNKVALAKERMRVQTALYRGQDDRGRPFTIEARSAVQATSRDPIVDVLGMSARIGLESGPATISADKGRYNLETETVNVIGPILLTAADGYRLETSDVAVDLNSRTIVSDDRVEGRMPLGRFSANRLVADISDRTVTLSGNARLHIVQGGIR